MRRLRCAVSYVQTFNLSSVYPRTAELSVSKGWGTVSRQSNVMSTAFRHSCLVPPSSVALSSARASSCSPIRSIPGRDGTLHAGAQCQSAGSFLHSRRQFRRPGHVRTIQVGRSKRQRDSYEEQTCNTSKVYHTCISRGLPDFRALRSGTVKIPVDSHRPHICDWSQRGTDGMYLTLKEKEVVLHQYAERAAE